MPNDPDSQESGKLGRYWRCYRRKSSESGALQTGIMIPCSASGPTSLYLRARAGINIGRLFPSPLCGTKQMHAPDRRGDHKRAHRLVQYRQVEVNTGHHRSYAEQNLGAKGNMD